MSFNLDVELDADNIVTRARSLLFNIKLKESLSSTLFAAFEEKLTQTVSFSHESMLESLDC